MMTKESKQLKKIRDIMKKKLDRIIMVKELEFMLKKKVAVK